MDPITIGLLAGGGLGMLKGHKNKQKDIEDALERRATMLYSPWTGMKPGAKVEREDALTGALGGAAQGAMLGSMMGKASPTAAATEAGAVQKTALSSGKGPLGVDTSYQISPEINAMASGGANEVGMGNGGMGMSQHSLNSLYPPMPMHYRWSKFGPNMMP